MGRALRLLVAILGVVLSLAAPADEIRIGGTGSALGTMKVLGDAFSARNPTHGPVTIMPNLGSSGGIKALQAGVIDIAVTSRPLKEKEQRSDQDAFEYGRSPFGVVTGKAGITQLTVRQVADLVSGRATTWPDGEAVRVVLRPSNDTDSLYFGQMAPEIAAALEIAHQRPGMKIAATDQDAASEAESLPGSLSTNTLSLLLSERRRLRMIALDGVQPSRESLASGAYTFYKPFYIVTRRGAPEGVREFLAFVRSPEGRSLLEANGHIVDH